MLIAAPKFQHLPLGGWRFSSLIQYKDAPRPRELWFELTYHGADPPTPPQPILEPFVATLFLVAMQNREEIQVQGPLCPVFAQGLKRAQALFHSWYPSRFQEISITALGERRSKAPRRRDLKTTAAFSGGVDSFYTLLTQNPQAALFIAAGFDMPARNQTSVAALTDSTRTLMRERGVELWVASTNAREFVDTVDWTNVHGAVLASCALFMEQNWDQFLVPSSYLAATHPKWGTHPELDQHFSTRGLRFIHTRETADRVTKLQRLIQEPQTYSRLRVCWIQDIGLRNCGQCEKCLRTLAALTLLGADQKYTTFDLESRISLIQRLRHLPQRNHQSRLFSWEIITHAIKRGQLRIAGALGVSLIRRRVRRAVRAIQSRN